MAMGLVSLGRETKSRVVAVAIFHVLGAAVGGALAGAALGSVGLAFGAGSWQSWIVGGAAMLAVLRSSRARPIGYGRRCQVPRHWTRTMTAGRLYFLWGVLLGSGLATLIPHSAFLVLAAAEFTSGPLLGAGMGLVFGGLRESLALVPLLAGLDHVQTAAALPRFRRAAMAVHAVVASCTGVAFLSLALRR